MKLILALLLITAALTATPSTSQATDCRVSTACAPTLLSTCEVGRRNECLVTTDHCGRRTSLMVTVVTFRSHFSDGSSRTFSRTFRA